MKNVLKLAIKKKRPQFVRCDAEELDLFLAKKHKDDAWLVTERDVVNGASHQIIIGMKRLPYAEAKLEYVGLSKPHGQCDNITDEDVAEGKSPVRVLVNIPSDDQSSALGRRLFEQVESSSTWIQHSAKKRKTEPVAIAYKCSIGEEDAQVALESISAFEEIKKDLLSADRHLYLLYGPPQFGKTTIAQVFIVSPLMHQLCVESLPAREIELEIDDDQDSLSLLSVALQNVNPEGLSHAFEKIGQSSSEASLHLELFAITRGILKMGSRSYYWIPRANAPESQTRAGILVTEEDEVEFGYVLKADRLLEKDISNAARQADEYRKRFDFERMVVVNFDPEGHAFDPVNRIAGCQVEVVHIQVNATCDEFAIHFLPDGFFYGKLDASRQTKVKIVTVKTNSNLSRK